MIWGELTFAIAFALVGVIPGLLALRAVRIGWPTGEELAAAVGLSLALVSFAAYAVELCGLPMFAPTVLAFVTLLIIALRAVHVRSSTGRWRLSTREGGARRLHLDAGQLVAAAVVLGCAAAVIVVLEPVRSVALLPPSTDDGVHHATWFRLIYERATVAPAAVYASPVSDHAPVYYPWGFHAWAAVLADLTAVEPIEVYRRAVWIIAGCLPLSVFVLAGRFFPRGWPRIAAAVCSILFWWLPFQPFLWGGYPLLAGAVSLPPLARLTVEALERRSTAAVALAGLVGLGLLFVHPSQAMGALLVATVLAVGSALRGALSGRAAAVCVGAVALVALVFIAGPRVSPEIALFKHQADKTAFYEQPKELRAGITTATWLGKLYLGRDNIPLAVGLCCALGLLASAVRPSWRVLLALHAFLVALLPLAQARTWLTVLWYHASERLWYLQIAVTPLLAAAGLWTLVSALRRLHLRVLARRPAYALIWPLVLAGVLVFSRRYFQDAGRRWAKIQRTMVTDHRALLDFAWIREHIPKDETILNVSADHGLVLPFTGRMLAFPNCQVRRSVGRYELAVSAIRGRLPERAVRRQLRQAKIRYIYEGIFAGKLRIKPHRVALGGHDLDSFPWIERIYASPTARIYRLRDSGG